jgi:ElaB/YqjD/DUF883 family membrane-anchored ribosome-binding protein
MQRLFGAALGVGLSLNSARQADEGTSNSKGDLMSRIDNPSGQGGGGASGNLGETAAQVGQNLRDLGSQARDTATQQYEQYRQQAQEYYEQGRERAREVQQNLEQYVQDQPVKALLIAAGVGMLLGIIWKRS